MKRLLLLLALTAAPAWCTITLVQSPTPAANTNQSTISKAFASNTTAGNMVIAAVYIGDGTRVTAINWGNAGFVQVYKNAQTNDGHTTAIAYYPNIPGGAMTVTVSWTDTANPTCCNNLHIYEFSGLATSSPLDQTTNSGATASGTTQTSGNVTTTQANELLFGFVGYSGANATATGESGWTSELVLNAGTTNGLSEYKIVAATGTYAATSTTSVSENYDAGIVTFLGASGAATPAFVQGKNCTSTTGSTTQTCTITGVTSGNTLIAFFHWDDSAAAANNATLTISGGTGCTMAAANPKNRDSAENPAIQSAYCATTAGGSFTITGTFSHSSTYTEILIGEYSGVGALDKHSENSNNNGTPSTACTSGATAAQTQTGDLAVGICTGWDQTQTWGTVSGWNTRSTINIASFGWYDEVLGSTAAATFSKTLTTADQWNSAVATFAPGAGGGGATAAVRRLTLLGVGP